MEAGCLRRVRLGSVFLGLVAAVPLRRRRAGWDEDEAGYLEFGVVEVGVGSVGETEV